MTALCGYHTFGRCSISRFPLDLYMACLANLGRISETEVTYELWREDLSDQQPATAMNWRDAMVWCNALTEYYNAANGTSLACAFTHQGQVVRDSTHANWTVCNAVLADESINIALTTPALKQESFM